MRMSFDVGMDMHLEQLTCSVLTPLETAILQELKHSSRSRFFGGFVVHKYMAKLTPLEDDMCFPILAYTQRPYSHLLVSARAMEQWKPS